MRLTPAQSLIQRILRTLVKDPRKRLMIMNRDDVLVRGEIHWVYEWRGYNPAGRLMWVDENANLVTTEGLNTLLGRCFDSPGADANWYTFLKGAGTIAAGDVMNSHAGWSEVTAYSNGTRPAWTKNGSPSGGSMSNSSSVATFNMNGSFTAAGTGMASNSTKGGTTGLLFGAVDFADVQSGGSGATITVRADLTITSA